MDKFSFQEKKYLPPAQFSEHLREEQDKITNDIPPGPVRELVFDIVELNVPADFSSRENLIEKALPEYFAAKVHALEPGEQANVLAALEKLHEVSKEWFEFKKAHPDDSLITRMQKRLGIYKPREFQMVGDPEMRDYFFSSLMIPHLLKKLKAASK